MAPGNYDPRDIPSDDELDAILNGEKDIGDIAAATGDQAQQNAQKSKLSAKQIADLGLEEQIVVKKEKKRTPIPKLDETRLLSSAGIPKLRKISKERLKFKGKGHEYGDIARMLNMYQLWLDDLYPRAKFADGLAMIEKLGHSKSIQLHRKAWIAEGKPGHATGSDAEEDVVAMPDEAMDRDTDHMEGVVEGDTAREPGLQDKRPQEPETRTLRPADDDPDEDELDALLAEVDLQNISVAPRPPLTAPEEDSFDDDMEAMAEMEGMW